MWRRAEQDSTGITQYIERSITAYDSRQHHKLKAILESRKTISIWIRTRKVERELVSGPGRLGPRAWLSGWIFLLGLLYWYIKGQGIVQSDLDSINCPYTVLTSVVEMKPKGTCWSLIRSSHVTMWFIISYPRSFWRLRGSIVHMEYLRNDYDISRTFSLAQQILILHLRLLWSTEIKIGWLGATIPNLSKIVVAHGGKSQKKKKQTQCARLPRLCHKVVNGAGSDELVTICSVLRSQPWSDSVLITYIRAYYRIWEGRYKFRIRCYYSRGLWRRHGIAMILD